MRTLPSNYIDLIYLDPPFNSNRAYNVIYKDDMGQAMAFEDTWYWNEACEKHMESMSGIAFIKSNYQEDMWNSIKKTHNILEALIFANGKTQLNAYLVNMAVRLVEMRRLLKDTGSIYLHCDPTAGHYLKILMDNIFGTDNIRNEIVWCYTRARPGGKYQFARLHDLIYFYSKSEGQNVFSRPQVPLTKEALRIKKIVRKDGSVWNRTRNTKDMGDWWDDVNFPTGSKERMGYPTQKPLKLLKRIIEASSNPGDVVLDPFCGCGTTIEAAEDTGRHWIGIDITAAAVGVIKERFLRKVKGETTRTIWNEVEEFNWPKTRVEFDNSHANPDSKIHPTKEFEKFCVISVGGLPNVKMGADGGIDGRIKIGSGDTPYRAIISVKSGHVSVTDVRELKGLLGDNNKVGVFITQKPPTRDMMEFAKKQKPVKPFTNGFESFTGLPKIQILTLDEVLKGKRPNLESSGGM